MALFAESSLPSTVLRTMEASSRPGGAGGGGR